MPSFLELLSKSESSIFEDIIKCPQCLTNENICTSHAEDIKKILMNHVKDEIEKLTIEKMPDS